MADTSYGVSTAPNGDLVLAGITEGSLVGESGGRRDVYLARYSLSGELSWSLQTGGAQNDSPLGVSVAPDGSIYVGGFTDGDFASPNQGSADVWLARYDSEGNELWRRQFGSEAWDRGFGVVAFDGGAYITGYTSGVLDPATDLGGFDGFAAKYDDQGNQQWVRHIGTDATDWGQGAALAPDDGLYMTGYTEGDLGGANAGDKDLFAVRINPDGSLAWSTQLGTTALDWTQGVGLGPDGGVLLAGSTEGDFGSSNDGGRDMIVVSLDADGDEQWRWQMGGPGDDSAFEVRAVGDLVAVSGSITGAPGQAEDERRAVLFWLLRDGGFYHPDWVGAGGVADATGLDAVGDRGVIWSGHTAGTSADDGGRGSDLMFGFQPPPPR